MNIVIKPNYLLDIFKLYGIVLYTLYLILIINMIIIELLML